MTHAGDPFVGKVIRLAKMLCNAGHEVHLLGAEGDGVAEYVSSQFFNFVSTHSIADIAYQYGEYDWTIEDSRNDFDKPWTELTRKFYGECTDYVQSKATPDDFLLLTLGLYHQQIADACELPMTCEVGIGYTGWCPRVKYHSFESYAIRNYLYGKRDPVNIMGSGNDRVIPGHFDLDDFYFLDRKDDYFLFLGRMIANKGPDIAANVATSLGVKLIMAGQGARLEDDGFLTGNGFMIPPGTWEYIGFVHQERRKDLLAGAKAVFAPTRYLEPFGNVCVEARLSGTPVITTDWGAFPEQILDGVDGWCCNTMADFINAAKMSLGFGTDNYKRIRSRALRFAMNFVVNEYQKWFYDIRSDVK